MAKGESRVVITRSRLRLRGVLWTLLALSLSLAAWGIFEYGRLQGGYDRVAAARTETQLSTRIKQLQEANERLRQQVARLEQAASVDHQASKQLDRTVKDLQDEILELKEEVAFYRGIVEVEQGAQGVRLQSVQVKPNGEPRGYTFKLVISQGIRGAESINGRLSLALEGLQEGAQQELAWGHLTHQEDDHIPLSFKYFQTVRRDVVLPEGFVPTRLVVKIVARDPKTIDIQETYDWSAILGASSDVGREEAA